MLFTNIPELDGAELGVVDPFRTWFTVVAPVCFLGFLMEFHAKQ
jgi:hypothetical protein